MGACHRRATGQCRPYFHNCIDWNLPEIGGDLLQAISNQETIQLLAEQHVRGLDVQLVLRDEVFHPSDLTRDLDLAILDVGVKDSRARDQNRRRNQEQDTSKSQIAFFCAPAVHASFSSSFSATLSLALLARRFSFTSGPDDITGRRVKTRRE